MRRIVIAMEVLWERSGELGNGMESSVILPQLAAEWNNTAGGDDDDKSVCRPRSGCITIVATDGIKSFCKRD